MAPPGERTAPSAARLERLLSRLVGRASFWLLVTGALFAWPIAWSLTASPSPPPPVLWPAPRFELVDQGGRPFGSAELAGRTWLASFVFTRCTTACPAIGAVVARIQDRTRALEPAFHLVTFTVDPAHDTPARLAAWAAARHASPRMWSLLTGPEAEVRAALAGFRVAAGGGADAPVHGTALLLVDGLGRVRALYHPEDPGVADRVVHDVGLLVNREGNGGPP